MGKGDGRVKGTIRLIAIIALVGIITLWALTIATYARNGIPNNTELSLMLSMMAGLLGWAIWRMAE